MKKIIQALLLTAAILAFAGWGKAEPNTGNQHTLRATETSATKSTAEAETDGKAGENEPEVPTEKEEIGETPTEDLPDTTAAPIETTTPPAPQEPKEPAPVEREPPTTEPPKTEPVVTEPPKQTDPPAEPPKQTEPPTEPSNPPRTEPPTEPPVATEPPRPTPPPATQQPTEPPAVEEPTAPAFDIGYWVSYAQSYAQSVGLRLESSAVDCWDNPITAGAHSIYLERDLQGMLNRYARDEDITDVWIWAESIGNGEYNIYIGYA